MNSYELTAAVTALANTIASACDDDQLTMMGVIFTQLGDTLVTITTQRSLCQKQSYSLAISLHKRKGDAK